MRCTPLVPLLSLYSLSQARPLFGVKDTSRSLDFSHWARAVAHGVGTHDVSARAWWPHCDFEPHLRVFLWSNVSPAFEIVMLSSGALEQCDGYDSRTCIVTFHFNRGVPCFHVRAGRAEAAFPAAGTSERAAVPSEGGPSCGPVERQVKHAIRACWW